MNSRPDKRYDLWFFVVSLIGISNLIFVTNANEWGNLAIKNIEGDFFVISNLPNSRVDILRSSDLKTWRLAYKGIKPEDGSCVIRGNWRLSNNYRIIPAAPDVISSRIIYVSQQNGDDLNAEFNNQERPFSTLQKAFQVCDSGDIIYVESGEYQIKPIMTFGVDRIKPNLELRNKKNIKIIGQGEVVLNGKGPGEYLRIIGCENVLIQGIEFRGNKPEVPENPVRLFTTVELAGYNQSIRFYECRFVRFGNHAISQLHTPRASRSVFIENCHFEDGGDASVPLLFHDGAAVSGIGSEWFILNNTLIRCNRGIEVEGAFPNFPTNGVVIEGNEIIDSNNIAIMIFSTNAPSDHYKNIVIRNNKIKHRHDNSASGVVFDGLEEIKIDGNEFRGYAVGVHIFPVKNIENVDITENDFIECDFGIYTTPGVARLKKVDVLNNRFIRNTDFGLVSRHGEIRILGNQFIDYGTWLRYSAGVALQGTTLGKSQYLLADNFFSRDQEISNSRYDIIVDRNVGYFQIQNNILEGSMNGPKISTLNWNKIISLRVKELERN